MRREKKSLVPDLDGSDAQLKQAIEQICTPPPDPFHRLRARGNYVLVGTRTGRLSAPALQVGKSG